MEDSATTPISLSATSFDEEEQTRVREALAGRVAGNGPFGQKVEERLERLLGAHRVLLTTSCTHALELALLAHGIGAGDEVVCPSFTFVSTANAILRVGARPVFADIEDRTLGLDAGDVARRLGPRTAALLPVHYAGVAPDMDRLQALARDARLKVIEDAAQGLAAEFRGRALGTLADGGCFSFHETKNITCGEGGALALMDEEVAARAEIIREKGTNRAAFLRGEVDKYTWVAEGSSYVLSDILAAVLDAQLDKLEAIQQRRAWAAARYQAGLADWARANGVRLPPAWTDRRVNHHLFYVLMPDEAARDRLQARLRSLGVLATFHYVPLHSAPHGRALGLSGTGLAVTERVAGSLLRLPLHAQLSAEDVDRVMDSVRRSFP
jgi:dTDP-4-amino-4,6-dideoxygalactose transaminase